MAKRLDVKPFDPMSSDTKDNMPRQPSRVSNNNVSNNQFALPSATSNGTFYSDASKSNYSGFSKDTNSILGRKSKPHAALFELSGALRKLKPHVPNEKKTRGSGPSSSFCCSSSSTFNRSLPSPRTARVVHTEMKQKSSNKFGEQIVRNQTGAERSPARLVQVRQAIHDESNNDPEATLMASLNLRTGDDVISFFALHGTQGPLKVVYLNRAPSGNAFRPYDLVAVLRQRANAEHFIMSAAGVVVINPPWPSDFQPLAEWTRYSTLYNVVSSISFFKHFLVRKMLHNWRQSIRFKIYKVKRKELASRLFLAKKAFCAPLTTVRRYVGDVASLRFLESRVQHTNDLTQLMHLQTQKRNETVKSVEALQDKVHQEVEMVCTNVSNRVQVAEEAYTAMIEMGDTHQDVRNKSMVILKQERAKKLKRKQQTAWDAQMLPSFIRLVDYMTMESLRCATLESQTEFLQDLVAPARKVGLIETAVYFNETGIEFVPACESVLAGMNELSDNMVGSANQIIRILFVRPFKAIVADTIHDAPNARTLILTSEAFQVNRDAVCHKVRTDFSEAAKVANVFESVRAIHEYKTSFDHETYTNASHTIASIKHDISTLTQWGKDLEKMKVSSTTGILHVESRRLRASLTPVTEEGMARVKAMLVVLASTRCQNLLEEYASILRELDEKPKQLKEFAKHVKYVRSVSIDTNSVLKNTAIVEELYRLCAHHNIKVKSEDMVMYDDLRHFADKFGIQRREAEAYIDERLPEMTTALDLNIAKIGDQCLQIRDSLMQGIFIDANANPKEVFEQLDGVIEGKLDQLETLARTYSSYQELFNIAEFDFKTLKEAKQLFQIQKSLWQRYQDWQVSHQMWFTTVFDELDLDKVKGVVQEITMCVYSTRKQLDSPVVDQLTERLEKFKQVLPMILDLGNPSMKQRHWCKLFERLGESGGSSPPPNEFNLGHLESAGVFGHQNFVSNLASCASGEEQIEITLGNIRQSWEEAEFQVLPYGGGGSRSTSNDKTFRRSLPSSPFATIKTTPPTFILGSIDDIFALLEDSQVTVNTMLGSRYIQDVFEEAEAWRQKLSILSQVLDEWLTCQRNWMYLENIFTSESIQRHMPEEVDQFLAVDKSWRETMARTSHDTKVLRAINKGQDVVKEMKKNNEILDTIQKRLEEHLEVKRAAFPRFFFLSNDELLEMMAQASDPSAIQSFFSKSFEAVSTLELSNPPKDLNNSLLSRNVMQKQMNDDQHNSIDNGSESEYESESDYSAFENSDDEEAGGSRTAGQKASDLITLKRKQQRRTDAKRRNSSADGRNKSKSNRQKVIGLNSQEGEYVPLIRPVVVKGTLESWLGQVEIAMMESIDQHMVTALTSYAASEQIDRRNWVFSHPAQTVLAVDQVFWTQATEVAVMAQSQGDSTALSNHLSFAQQQIDAMIVMARSKVTKLQKTLVAALLVLDVHARDVVKTLTEENVRSISDFAWTKQLRFYVDNATEVAEKPGKSRNEGTSARKASVMRKMSAVRGFTSSRWFSPSGNSAFKPMPTRQCDLVVRQTCTTSPYSYEYLGNSTRLVVTPLTELCYMTLTCALHMGLGGAPSGPAGTGKTETTKDLAKALARQCVVFNCSENLDHTVMGRFFSGLAQCGAWACFDEFNRIDLEVLSVIAQQVLTIQHGVHANSFEMDFDGKTIALRTTLGIFITMNPGYAGRAELPDNLKALFRPVAMMVPDYKWIAEIVLLSEGFGDARTLARKMVLLYRLSSEQLSKQGHYDFGMRAVKSVLVAAGKLKSTHPDENEHVLLIRAMRDSNVPKLLEQDLPLFANILTDLFPGENIPQSDHRHLRHAIIAECSEQNLQPTERFVNKVIQVHETQAVRHGLMLVGEMGAGKSSSVSVLAHALSNIAAAGVVSMEDDPDQRIRAVQRMSLNPKAIHVGMLYGHFNVHTGEWKDGLIPQMVRSCVHAESDGIRKWILFDGPVDAVWIENMNTVLDDNKTLCLANSERIRVPSTVHMMFEVQDLAVASPATVSRCGMIYMEQVVIGVHAIVDSWVRTQEVEHCEGVFDENVQDQQQGEERSGPHMPLDSNAPLKDNHCQRLGELVKKHLPNGFHFLQTNCETATPVLELHLTSSLLRLLSSMLQSKRVPLSKTQFNCEAVDMIFVFSFAWALGATTKDISSRQKINQFVSKQLFSLLAGKGKVDDIFQCFVDIPTKSFVPWSKLTPTYVHLPNMPWHRVFVSTPESICQSYLLSVLLSEGGNVICVGESGAGKSSVIDAHLSDSVASENITTKTIDFSSLTKPEALISVLESTLEVKRRNLLGPEAGKRMVVNINDVNMPLPDEYGAQPPLELLRQLMTDGGFYDTDKLFFKSVADTDFVASCVPRNYGGQTAMSPRFLRHFFVLSCMPMSQTSMARIYESILGQFLQHDCYNLAGFAGPIATASADLLHAIKMRMLPTPTKCHYSFDLRDLSNIFQGLLCLDHLVCTTKADICQLWVHEATRVFRDRLLSDSDRQWFDEKLIGAAEIHLGEKVNTHSITSIRFGKFMSEHAHEKRKQLQHNLNTISTPIRRVLYARLPDEKTTAAFLQDLQEELSLSQNSNLNNLVFFNYVVDHICRISRILQQERGHALLLGVGGSGRRSLTRMAAFAAGCTVYYIEITKDYGRKEFRAEIKTALLALGCAPENGPPLVFLFSDTQILESAFLEDIHNLLSTGTLPGLYDADDMNSIYAAVRNENMQAPSFEGTTDALEKGLVKDATSTIASKTVELNDNARPQDGEEIDISSSSSGGGRGTDAILTRFVERIRRKLHIVLAFSPAGDSFRVRCSQFPSLVALTTTDWFDPWPSSGLYSVCEAMIKRDETLGLTREHALAICELCVYMHESATEATETFGRLLGRYGYVTPTCFLELLSIFKSGLVEKRKHIADNLARYNKGLFKLTEAEGLVASLQDTLTLLMSEIEVAHKETQALLEHLAMDQQEADAARFVAQADEAAAQEVAEEVKTIKEECERELQEALPALHDAIKALDSLDKKSIQEVKSFSQPPKMVAVTLEAVCILLGVKAEWSSAKKLMNDTHFLQNLKDFDKDNIDAKTVKKLLRYVEDPEFTPAKMKSVSTAACSFCMWVTAMYRYYGVAKTIEPKKKRLTLAVQSSEVVMRDLNVKQEGLRAKTVQVALLEQHYQESIARKEQLEHDASKTEAQLITARKLISGLADEKVRWTAASLALQQDAINVPGNLIVASSAIAYTGVFTAEYRDELLRDWVARCADLGVPIDMAFSLERILSHGPDQVREWTSSGLPGDQFSIQNALISMKAKRWPLMIDPQGQANKWLKTMFSAINGNLQIVQFSELNYMRTIENAVRFGFPVLLENVGATLDPTMEPVITQNTTQNGGQLMLQIGDHQVPYSPNFRLFITCPLANPHFLPEIFCKVTVVNFMVTVQGLEDQLLVDVVKTERLDLEKMQSEVVKTIVHDTLQLRTIEDRILQLLAESSGNLLEDRTLVDELDRSKVTSETITKRRAEAELTRSEIMKTMEEYRIVATRGSVLYFTIADLAQIGWMYQFSLQWFQQTCIQQMAISPQGNNLETRLRILLRDITKSVFDKVCCALFEKDRVAFAFKLAVSIGMRAADITAHEYLCFLHGPQSNGSILTAVKQDESLAWLPLKSWAEIESLAAAVTPNIVSCFQKLPASLKKYPKQWQSWATEEWEQQQQQQQQQEIYSIESEKRFNRVGGDNGSIGPDEVPDQTRNPKFPEIPVLPPLPDPELEALFTPFQRLLLVRTLCKHRLVQAAQGFAESELDLSIISRPGLTSDLETAFQHSTASDPIIVVLGPGANVLDYLLPFAEAQARKKEEGRGGKQNMKVVSLGQGQGPIAESAIHTAKQSGDWVCLQNCHLAESWLPRLEAIVVANKAVTNSKMAAVVTDVLTDSHLQELNLGMQNESVSPNGLVAHKDFRLWLTSSPSQAFPISVLQGSVKLTSEPPKGLRANILRTLQDMPNEKFERSSEFNSGTGAQWKRLVFSVAYYNALISERKKYGAIGWNISYDWMRSDLTAALQIMHTYVQVSSEHKNYDSVDVTVNKKENCLVIAQLQQERQQQEKQQQEKQQQEQHGIQLDALRVMVGYVTYGGRITDAQDQRTNECILNQFISKAVVIGRQQCSPSGGVGTCDSRSGNNNPKKKNNNNNNYNDGEHVFWQAPVFNADGGNTSLVNLQHFVENSMPQNERPEMLGLHENARAALDLGRVHGLMESMSAMREGRGARYVIDTKGNYAQQDNGVENIDSCINRTNKSTSASGGGNTDDVNSTKNNNNNNNNNNQVQDTIIAENDNDASMGQDALLLKLLRGFSEGVKEAIKSLTTVLTPNAIHTCGLDPISIFIGQERHRFKILLSTMQSSIISLQNALRGTIVMSPELDDMHTRLIHKRVPVSWERVAYTSLKQVGSWVTDLLQRVRFICNSNLSIASSTEIVPKSFWISALFFPQGLITAVVQKHARESFTPIDDLRARTHLTDILIPADVDSAAPSGGIYIHGIYLEGARFNSEDKQVEEALPGVHYEALPLVYVYPEYVQENGNPKKNKSNGDGIEAKIVPQELECPLYKTTMRAGTLSTTGHSSNFVMNVSLPCAPNTQDHWLRRGIALLCMLED